MEAFLRRIKHETDKRVIEALEKDVATSQKACFEESDRAESRLADPGENFSATCVIYDNNAPPRRLIFAGIAPQSWFIYYEHGGIAYNRRLIMFKLDNGEPAIKLSAYCIGDTIKKLKASVRRQRGRYSTVSDEKHGFY